MHYSSANLFLFLCPSFTIPTISWSMHSTFLSPNTNFAIHMLNSPLSPLTPHSLHSRFSSLTIDCVRHSFDSSFSPLSSIDPPFIQSRLVIGTVTRGVFCGNSFADAATLHEIERTLHKKQSSRTTTSSRGSFQHQWVEAATTDDDAAADEDPGAFFFKKESEHVPVSNVPREETPYDSAGHEDSGNA